MDNKKHVRYSWASMKQRCSNPNHAAYKDYGGRGISFPKKWESFAGFYDDMGASYEGGLMLDRIDNNKGYSKENCRWATRKINNNNKRNTLFITFRGRTQSLTAWADEIGINRELLRNRWYKFSYWPIEKIFSGRKFHKMGFRKTVV